MKASELHRIIQKNGWEQVPGRGKGSHIVYQKEGKKCVVPFHKGKEIYDDFAKRILKEMGINC